MQDLGDTCPIVSERAKTAPSHRGADLAAVYDRVAKTGTETKLSQLRTITVTIFVYISASTNRPVSPPEAGPSNASILSPAEEMFGLLTGAAPVKQLVEITDTKLEDNEYLVKKILKHRNNSKHGLQYLIRWEGYSSSHDSWEPASNLNAELVAKYHIKKK